MREAKKQRGYGDTHEWADDVRDDLDVKGGHDCGEVKVDEMRKGSLTVCA